MRFDLVDLRLVMNIAEAASITHGASRSGLALASASERLRDLERTLGVTLFERQRRGVSPTSAGLALLHHARIVTRQLDQMSGELGQFAKGLRGRVRVLSNTAATLEFLPPLIGRFLADHPNVDLEIEERASPEIVRAVAGGRADLGIVADAVDAAAELETVPFALDRLVLVDAEASSARQAPPHRTPRCAGPGFRGPACRQRACRPISTTRPCARANVSRCG